jgi:predicted component of type VI protein secretion system
LQAESHAQLHGLTVDLPAAPTPSPLGRLRSLWRSGRPGLLAPATQLAAGRIVLGRSSACQLVLSDDTVSRRHAELRLVDGRWHLRDLGSSNGTWVNGRRVVEAEVVPGDEVQLGACRLRL